MDQGPTGARSDNRRAKYYELTKTGRLHLPLGDSWQKLTAAVAQVLDPAQDSAMLSDLFFRLRSVLRRGTVESEMEEELRFTPSGSSRSISRQA